MEAAKEATAVARNIEWKQNDEAVNQMKTKFGVKFYTFKEKQQMMDRTKAVRERVAKDVGVTEIFEAIEQEGKK
jgi:TRAP-type C4-dicarboxylate transport system substrate-binding protein